MTTLPERDVSRLLTCKEVCFMFGGIHPSTLYRGIRKRRYPAPVNVGPNSSRWVAGECAATLQAMCSARRLG
jgi:predicted DNA-binding transcriptional regulator AlpA